MRALPLPPRLARMVVDAARDGCGERAAQMAVLVTERGLGGNDAELSHRLDQFRRDRSRRADEARGMARRWAEAAGDRKHESEQASARSSRSPFPDRIAKNRGGGQGGVPACEWTRRRSRSGLVACARAVHCRGGIVGQRGAGAHPACGADFASRDRARYSPTGSRRAKRSPSIPRPSRCAGEGTSPRRHCVVGTDNVGRASPENAEKLAKAIAAAGLDRLPWSKHLNQWRDRVLFLRKSEGDEWRDLSNEALAVSAAGMAGAAFRRQDRAEGAWRRRSFKHGDGIAAVEHAAAA